MKIIVKLIQGSEEMMRKTILIIFINLMFIISGCNDKSPPLPKVVSGDIIIPVYQSSYSWGKLGFRDCAFGSEALKGKKL